MFYANEVSEWAWPRVHVNVMTFTQFAQTAIVGTTGIRILISQPMTIQISWN